MFTSLKTKMNQKLFNNLSKNHSYAQGFMSLDVWNHDRNKWKIHLPHNKAFMKYYKNSLFLSLDFYILVKHEVYDSSVLSILSLYVGKKSNQVFINVFLCYCLWDINLAAWQSCLNAFGWTRTKWQSTPACSAGRGAKPFFTREAYSFHLGGSPGPHEQLLGQGSLVAAWHRLPTTHTAAPVLRGALTAAAPPQEKWPRGLSERRQITPSLQHKATLQIQSRKKASVSPFSPLILTLYSLDRCLRSLSSWLHWISFFCLMTSLCLTIPWTFCVVFPISSGMANEEVSKP